MRITTGWRSKRFQRVLFDEAIEKHGSRAETLTRKQFGVLEELMRADGGGISAETLLEKVWND